MMGNPSCLWSVYHSLLHPSAFFQGAMPRGWWTGQGTERRTTSLCHIIATRSTTGYNHRSSVIIHDCRSLVLLVSLIICHLHRCPRPLCWRITLGFQKPRPVAASGKRQETHVHHTIHQIHILQALVLLISNRFILKPRGKVGLYSLQQKTWLSCCSL